MASFGPNLCAAQHSLCKGYLGGIDFENQIRLILLGEPGKMKFQMSQETIPGHIPACQYILAKF